MGRPRKPVVPYPDHEIRGRCVFLVEDGILKPELLPEATRILSEVCGLDHWAGAKRGPEPNAQIVAELVVAGLHLRNEGREVPTRRPDGVEVLMEVFHRHGVGSKPTKRFLARFVGPHTETQTKELISGWESEIAPHLPVGISDEALMGYWKCWADELVAAEYRIEAKHRKSRGRDAHVDPKDAEPDFYSYYLHRATEAIERIERLMR